MILILQIIRFLGIGFLNTAVDFAVLNFLMFLSGIFKGGVVGAFAVISFTTAVTHSFFWNKHWAFGAEGGGLVKNFVQFAAAAFLGVAVLFLVIVGAGQKYSYSFFLLMLVALLFGELVLWHVLRLGGGVLRSSSRKQFLAFIIVSVIGAGINAGILTFGTKTLPPQFGLDQALWTNLIKAGATGIALVWNFVGYKLAVFKQ